MPYTCIDITLIENGQMNLDQNHCHTLLMLIMFIVPSLYEIFIPTTNLCMNSMCCTSWHNK